MSGKRDLGDLTALLYAAPFAVSGIYAIYLWAVSGVYNHLPSGVYLHVTESPYVFAIGGAAVMLAVVLDEGSVDRARRAAKVESLADLLQNMAVAALVLSVVFVLIATGFNVSDAATDFLTGRYDLVFPAFLFVFGYLLSAKFAFGAVAAPKVIGVILLVIISPFVYELSKHHIVVALWGSFAMLILGLLLLLGVLPPPKKEAPAEKPADS